MGISRSGYYHWKRRKSERAAREREYAEKVRNTFVLGEGTYGASRICGKLRQDGFPCSFYTEFTNRKLSNENYVEVLYKVLLGRASDSKGKADWVAQLKEGKSRLEIFRGFAHSQEFEKICSEYGIVRGTV